MVALDEGSIAVLSRDDNASSWQSEDVSLKIVEETCASIKSYVLRGEEVTRFRRADQAYRTAEQAFSNDGIGLRALLLTPEHPRAAVVFIHGAGDSDRDNIWYLRIAHHLAKNGISVLLPDKRGVGQSEGDWRTASFEGLADDAVEGVRQLAAELPESTPIGVLGISQGGWIAPIAASQSSRIGFVISLVGPVVSLAEQQKYLIQTASEAMQLDGELTASLHRLLDRGAHFLRTGEGWEEYESLRSELASGPAATLVEALPADRDDWQWAWGRPIYDFDPLPAWSSLEIPTLAIFGEEDSNIPTRQSIARLRTGAPQVEVLSLERRGHGLMAPTGDIDPRVLERLTEFILNVHADRSDGR